MSNKAKIIIALLSAAAIGTAIYFIYKKSVATGVTAEAKDNKIIFTK
jgi:hypothetical protein